MSSKIRSLLEESLNMKRGDGESNKDYYARLATGVQQMKEAEWQKLPSEAQDWFDAACVANEKHEALPPFPDEQEDEPPARRRRSSEEEAPATFTPKKGDKVKVTSKRGKVYEGCTWVEIDKGMIILDDGKDEIEACLQDGATVESAEAKQEEGGRRRRSAEDDQPKEPKVGDTVEIVNLRDKVMVGRITEISEKEVVFVDATGQTDDIPRDRIKSIKVKVDGAAVDATINRTRAGTTTANTGTAATGADTPREGRQRVSPKDNGGVSATTRIKELVLDNLNMDEAGIKKLLDKENIQCKDNTFGINFKEAHRFVKMMKERGWTAPR